LEGAKRHHQASIRIDPGFADGWMNLGNVLKALGQLHLAVQAYATAAQLRPDGAVVLYNLGAAHLARGDCPAALAAFSRSLAYAPDFALSHYSVGLCHQSAGNVGESPPLLLAAGFGCCRVGQDITPKISR
jgi:tetratricopeptide (TPR) repeat protein